MHDDIDLSGEEDPTERLTEQDARLGDEQPENHRKVVFEGEDRTEDFDLDEALDQI